jgi:hypothetical protein
MKVQNNELTYNLNAATIDAERCAQVFLSS